MQSRYLYQLPHVYSWTVHRPKCSNHENLNDSNQLIVYINTLKTPKDSHLEITFCCPWIVAETPGQCPTSDSDATGRTCPRPDRLDAAVNSPSTTQHLAPNHGESVNGRCCCCWYCWYRLVKIILVDTQFHVGMSCGYNDWNLLTLIGVTLKRLVHLFCLGGTTNVQVRNDKWNTGIWWFIGTDMVGTSSRTAPEIGCCAGTGTHWVRATMRRNPYGSIETTHFIISAGEAYGTTLPHYYTIPIHLCPAHKHIQKQAVWLRGRESNKKKHWSEQSNKACQE